MKLRNSIRDVNTLLGAYIVSDHNRLVAEMQTKSHIIHQEGRSQLNVILMGDFNSIAGEGSTDKVVGPFVLCKRNERGKMLINVCKQHDLIMMNTWLKKRETNLYTWKRRDNKTVMSSFTSTRVQKY